MVIRNAKLGGTDFSDGEVLYDYDLDDTNNAMYTHALTKFYADNTGAQIASSTTETDLVTIVVPQNDLTATTSFLINVDCSFSNNSVDLESSTFRLYVNGSVVKTKGLGGGNGISGSGSLSYLATSIDNSSSDTTIKVSAQNSASGAGIIGKVEGITIIGKDDN